MGRGSQALLFPGNLEQVVNVASVPKRSLFRYPGGKTWLVPHLRRWLRSLERQPSVFIEPFAGGGIAGLTVAFERLAKATLLVELDRDVAAVWETVLNGQAKALERRVAAFEMTLANVSALLSRRPRTRLDRAFATLVRNRVQHGGIMAPGASLMRHGENGKGIRSRWYAQTLITRIRAINSIRHRIDFECGDGFAAIEKHSADPDAVFFVDPPYTVAGRRLYRYADIDHRRLFSLMSSVAGEFLMTYDCTPEVRGWAKEHGFAAEMIAMQGRQNARKFELLIGRDLRWACQ